VIRRSVMAGQPVITPKAIKLAAGNDTLTIRWADDHLGVYPYQYLRDHCPCATCTDANGRHETAADPTSLPSAFPILGARALRPERAELVGRYAVRIYWSDQHSSGIYGFDRLREMCQCEQCVSNRLNE
jgi:DUF971 family protein